MPALASVLPTRVQVPSQIQKRDQGNWDECVNSPTTRGCWKDGFSIHTDFDLEVPYTGNTITYNWEITSSTCDPDGAGARACFRVHGEYPGPVLRATWGALWL